MVTKIKYDDLDWEDYCVPHRAMYKNKKFTGIAVDEMNEDGYEEWNFSNGLLNGRHYFFDKKNNTIIRESFYENGLPINTHFSWIAEHKHTKIYDQGELFHAKIEDSDGSILFEFDKEKMHLIEWFKSGNKRSEKFLISTDNFHQFTSEQYWNERGMWLMTTKDKTSHKFNHTYLLQHAFELDSEDEEKVFILFSEQLLEAHIDVGITYLQVHTTHKNPFFRYQSARLLSKTKDVSSIIFLEKLLTDHLQPETKLTIDWQGFGHSKKTEHTVSKMAQIAIDNIKNAQKNILSNIE